jgi:hypothetical protein
VSFWRVSDDGRLIGLNHECGPYGAAQQVEMRFPDPNYVAGPYVNCSPGPGEFANLMLTVEAFSPGGVRPQFAGPARNTLGEPTDERAVVSVLPDTEWIGAITRLEDVRSGMELQATGRRDDNCIILAETILSPASIPVTDDERGFTAEIPYGWREGAAGMPYATCLDCATFGPRDVPYAYGISVYTQSDDPGCSVQCYFSIRALLIEPAVDVVIDGHRASRAEIVRQAPLGLASETGDYTDYHTLATLIHRGADALLVVGFFREGDQQGEQHTRAAYEDFLRTLSVGDPAPTPATR